MIRPAGLYGGRSAPPCLLASFTATAARLADTAAIVDGAAQLSYAQLSAWIAAIAQLLAEEGTGTGDLVAVAGERGAPVVAAMWAVVGMGATYVPLDLSYPRARLEHMLADSGASLLLYTGHKPAWSRPRAVRIPECGTGRPGRWPRVTCDPDLPVYVIYTSGSTGRPKGVALPHRSIDNMAEWQRSHSVRPGLRTAQFAPLNFDVWFQEVLGTLGGGGTLEIMPEPLRRDPITLLEWLAASGIERLFLPCAALHMLAAAATAAGSLSRLKLAEINVAGEQLTCTPAIRDFFRRLPGCRLNNHYGQSESAMVSVHTLTGPSETWPALPPIGRPLPGCEVLLDAGDPASPDVGELLVAGSPVSDGYLNQPALSAERYVTIPRTPHGHTRAFRTGDIARIHDGTIQFLGRADHEVKVRGYRVNPLEVEAALTEQPGIAEAVCVPVEIGQASRHLRAAVTLTGGHPFDGAAVLGALAEVLPPYSVPLSVTALAELPRTPSGKIDRAGVTRLITADAPAGQKTG